MSYRNFFEDKIETKTKERISLWIEKDLKKKLKEIGQTESVSLNQVCREFLDLMIEQYEMTERNVVLEDTPWLYP